MPQSLRKRSFLNRYRQETLFVSRLFPPLIKSILLRYLYNVSFAWLDSPVYITDHLYDLVPFLAVQHITCTVSLHLLVSISFVLSKMANADLLFSAPYLSDVNFFLLFYLSLFFTSILFVLQLYIYFISLAYGPELRLSPLLLSRVHLQRPSRSTGLDFRLNCHILYHSRFITASKVCVLTPASLYIVTINFTFCRL